MSNWPKTMDELFSQIQIDADNGVVYNKELYLKFANKILASRIARLSDVRERNEYLESLINQLRYKQKKINEVIENDESTSYMIGRIKAILKGDYKYEAAQSQPDMVQTSQGAHTQAG